MDIVACLYQGIDMEFKINEPWIIDKVRCQGGYVYIDKPFWNAEKQRTDYKREYIEKFDC